MNKKANVWILAIVGVVAIVSLVVMFQGYGTLTGDFQFNPINPIKAKQVQNLAVNKYSDAIMRSSRKLLVPKCKEFWINHDERLHITGDQYCVSKGYSSCKDPWYEAYVSIYTSHDRSCTGIIPQLSWWGSTTVESCTRVHPSTRCDLWDQNHDGKQDWYLYNVKCCK